MNFDEMKQAVEDAQRTATLVDRFATDLARLLVGRLKSVQSIYLLAELKRELRDYNIHTKRWER